MEIWKYVKGYEGYYQISNLGRVKSVERYVWWPGLNCYHLLKERIMKPQLCRKGYARVQFKVDNVSKSFAVHRMVAEAFIPNPEGKLEVNHINSIRDDNRLENLEWATHSENQVHAYKFGNRDHKGNNHPQRKIDESIVKEIRAKYIPFKYAGRKLADEYGLKVSHIANIVRNKIWKGV